MTPTECAIAVSGILTTAFVMYKFGYVRAARRQRGTPQLGPNEKCILSVLGSFNPRQSVEVGALISWTGIEYRYQAEKALAELEARGTIERIQGDSWQLVPEDTLEADRLAEEIEALNATARQASAESH